MEQDYIKKRLAIKAFLDEMLLKKESNGVEFKLAKVGFPGSFRETYSSFANTEGGVVIFGVKDQREIVNYNMNVQNMFV